MSNKFKGKNILITGITGFVGSHLSKRLTELGATVYGLSTTVENAYIAKINIMDFEKVNAFVKKNHIQICYHLAGEPLVEKGQKKPYETFRLNILGTLNILESARINNMEKIIVASTSHVYGNHKLPYLESYAPKPSRPYETSKACTDLIAQAYAKTYDLPVLIPRFVNIYGPGDLNFSRLVPKTIQSILTKKTLKMWGGEALRDYLYIDDAVRAYVDLASVDIKTIDGNRIFNFGGVNTISVKELIAKIIEHSGHTVKITKTNEIREGEIRAQYVSFEKAKKLLGWMPDTNLDEGLTRTIEWYVSYFKALRRS